MKASCRNSSHVVSMGMPKQGHTRDSTYSKNRDHLNIMTLPFHSGEKHTNLTG